MHRICLTMILTPLKLCHTVTVVLMLILFLKQSFCSCLKTSQGLALVALRERVVRDPFGALTSWNFQDIEPCSNWFGVECSSHGNVVTLNLKDLCLEGTLAPEIGNLTHLKSIILRNNSFFGEIPKEILNLKELETLDFGYNNFSGQFPSELSKIPSLTTLLLDNNDFLTNLTLELYKLNMSSEFHSNDEQLSSATTREAFISRCCLWHIDQHRDVIAYRRKLILSESPTNLPAISDPLSDSPSPTPSSTFFTPSPSPIVSPTPYISPQANSPNIVSLPPQFNWVSSPSPSPFPNQGQGNTNISNPLHRSMVMWSAIGAFSFLIFVSAITVVCFQSRKVVAIKPWSTGLSGQLQKAFVTGVPNLKRVELEAACEYFSNIIGSLPEGTVYKGTLSSGIEIAVVSSAVSTSQNWSKNMEAQFRNKIGTLSRVNHKNYVNLIGYCEENKPLTRMMIFEYASNGTLFEHLHIKEGEELNWGTRMRIAMGIAYCLEYMHELNPPIAHKNLQSSSIYLTEDYAAKVSDLSFWNNMATIKKCSSSKCIKDNVYSFGIILLELVTGRIPHVLDNGLLADWAIEYTIRGQPLRDVVDPNLNSFQEDEIEKWFEVIRDCVHQDQEKRPSIREVTTRLKEITNIGADGANPKSSPLWWAEMELMSSDSS